MANRELVLQQHRLWELDFSGSKTASISDGQTTIIEDIPLEEAEYLIEQRNGSIDLLVDFIEFMDTVDPVFFDTFILSRSKDDEDIED
jgi:hypothetical protein